MAQTIVRRKPLPRAGRAREHGAASDTRRARAAHGRLGVIALATLAAACTRESNARQRSDTASPTAASRGSVALTSDTVLSRAGIVIPGREAEDGQWVRPAKDYASTRFSGLDQINASNVSQ